MLAFKCVLLQRSVDKKKKKGKHTIYTPVRLPDICSIVPALRQQRFLKCCGLSDHLIYPDFWEIFQPIALDVEVQLYWGYK